MEMMVPRLNVMQKKKPTKLDRNVLQMRVEQNFILTHPDTVRWKKKWGTSDRFVLRRKNVQKNVQTQTIVIERRLS